MDGSGLRVAPRRVRVVGAGLSGAVVARALADAGHQVTVQDERPHVAGNCHTARDPATGVMVHVYGPHIFHTANPEVWAYVNRFAEMVPFRHRVKAVAGGQVYSLPINLHTINQLFGRAMSPAEARAFLRARCETGEEAPRSFEDQALRLVGQTIYTTFFRGYTRKQWGVDPDQLPASILKRLPLRFDYDDAYFDHPHQALPRDGYTAMVARILDHPGIRLRLGQPFRGRLPQDADHLVYTGPLDRYFDRDLGPLGYRTLDFERFEGPGDVQGTAVVNYCDEDVPHTRITEHRHFSPWEGRVQGASPCFREYSRACGPNDIPYYPLRLLDDRRRLGQYSERAAAERDVTFVGRLGTYAYLDMDRAIERALDTARAINLAWAQEGKPAAFIHAP
ncbi:NAD(P)-binding protein [Pseudooceanicola sp. CBS1P-1]|uniref:NAD(P)-binding protein n=1 Tax=Pseudooceanicola albus TaxID=2692189 RepID=A0A6L7GB09_9RHOB|nr:MULTISPECIES: FAD-dependent oxidoreductase [Pseudooceanicola]MBT9386513.1 NAD(P)-binding protein [Pseudooceanicola endophyticus]MXN20546.1 NAD(P)-binding protein [Pseudooceanicola albus]